VLTPPGHVAAGRSLRATLAAGAGSMPAEQAAGAWQALLAGNAMAHCLPLFAALAHGAAAQVQFGIGPGSHLQLALAGGA